MGATSGISIPGIIRNGLMGIMTLHIVGFPDANIVKFSFTLGPGFHEGLYRGIAPSLVNPMALQLHDSVPAHLRSASSSSTRAPSSSSVQFPWKSLAETTPDPDDKPGGVSRLNLSVLSSFTWAVNIVWSCHKWGEDHFDVFIPAAIQVVQWQQVLEGHWKTCAVR